MKAKKRMTKTEFYSLIPKTGWRITDGDCEVRRNGVCPVCAVANKLLHKTEFALEFTRAAKAINLPRTVAGHIAHAADWSAAKGRSQLLKACGIKEDV